METTGDNARKSLNLRQRIAKIWVFDPERRAWAQRRNARVYLYIYIDRWFKNDTEPVRADF